jgi:hypothetical protein
MVRSLVLAAAVAAAGCSSARYVQRGLDEGVIAVPDRTNSWPSYNNDKALTLIKEHVGSDYEIVEEWAAKSGGPPQPPQGNGLKPLRDPSTNNQLFFLPNDPRPRGSAATDQADASELHIRYRRRTAGGGGWLPPATTGTTAAGLPTPAGPASGARTTVSPGIVPAGLRTDVPPLILPAAATTPAPNSVNPVTHVPPPVIPAGGFPMK